jgi:hypothetical protein
MPKNAQRRDMHLLVKKAQANTRSVCRWKTKPTDFSPSKMYFLVFLNSPSTFDKKLRNAQKQKREKKKTTTKTNGGTSPVEVLVVLAGARRTAFFFFLGPSPGALVALVGMCVGV